MNNQFKAYDLGGFVYDILNMNKTYTIPHSSHPEIPDPARIAKFKQILLEEINELDEIITPNENPESTILYLIKLSDLLADIIVYCTSEARRHGLPLGHVLYAVMESNFSKLDSNGKPIIDPKTQKFLKGPNYKPPEERIRQIILQAIKEKKD